MVTICKSLKIQPISKDINVFNLRITHVMCMFRVPDIQRTEKNTVEIFSELSIVSLVDFA